MIIGSYPAFSLGFSTIFKITPKKNDLICPSITTEGDMTGIHKGIILAGGAGNRLYPLTLVASKMQQVIEETPKSGYREYLERIFNEIS
jgi:hypothetical protein